MTETLTGKQVLVLLAQDEPPEIEYYNGIAWVVFEIIDWKVYALKYCEYEFRIKPTPARRLSVTLANGEVVSWPESVREALKVGTEFWYVDGWKIGNSLTWSVEDYDNSYINLSNVHLTREAAQEHADALRRINCQEVGNAK